MIIPNESKQKKNKRIDNVLLIKREIADILRSPVNFVILNLERILLFQTCLFVFVILN